MPKFIEVISDYLNRNVPILLITIMLASCSTLKSNDDFVKSDYEIAQLALSNFSKWDAYRLLEEPSTSTTDDYLNGFFAEGVNFSQQYAYKTASTEKWKKHLFNNQKIKNKLTIINDFKNIATTADSEKNNVYIQMSRPLYSKDGKYAVIIIDLFGKDSLWGGAGHGFIYEEINGKWQLHLKFTPYLV
ncbi:hypothetical protein [Flavobacterium litorale]|uniref:SnoaL-like domain-containing protein n=1 Tax=Flavobacterium litorale TaxID=2856519 RepID=A0ABX8V7R6_9FLAO|nr:hypothetical protein [Flavobacterium litorale]QYJ68866.1 hypothetical protein K1I41_03000 [Flavobacterium litorale]